MIRLIKMIEKIPGAKKEDIDAPVIRRILRYLAHPITILFIKLKITPNQVSFLYFFLSFIIAFLFYLNEYPYIVPAAILLFIYLLLDRVDGSIARIKRIENDYGFWLDKTLDTIARTVIFLGITWGVYNRTMDYRVWIFGYLAWASYLLITEFFFDFKSIFPFSKQIISSSRKKHQFLIQLFYNEPLLSILIIFFALFDSLYWFLVFSGIYGTICMLILYIMLTSKIKKGIKLYPQSTQHERI